MDYTNESGFYSEGFERNRISRREQILFSMPGHGASDYVLDDTKSLPDNVYTSASDVNRKSENK